MQCFTPTSGDHQRLSLGVRLHLELPINGYPYEVGTPQTLKPVLNEVSDRTVILIDPRRRKAALRMLLDTLDDRNR